MTAEFPHRHPAPLPRHYRLLRDGQPLRPLDLEIRRSAIDSNIGLLSTPTNASHLNRIECHFRAYVEFVINGSDYANWTEFSKATHAYGRRRNRDRQDPRIIELENHRDVA